MIRCMTCSSAYHEAEDCPTDVRGWWCISASVLLASLHRAKNGESPDMLYAELYANSKVEKP